MFSFIDFHFAVGGLIFGPKKGMWGSEGHPVVSGWVGRKVLCSEGRGVSWWERVDAGNMSILLPKRLKGKISFLIYNITLL